MTQNAEGCRHDGVTSAPQPVASVANGFFLLSHVLVQETTDGPAKKRVRIKLLPLNRWRVIRVSAVCLR